MNYKLLILLLSLLFGALAYAEETIKPLEFTGVDFSSQQKIQLNDYKGKLIYMDFWASWCSPCLKSMPFLEKLHQQYASDRFKIIAINIDEKKVRRRSF